MSKVSLLLLFGLVACGRSGFESVDHRVFFGAWSTRSPIEVAEGERTVAIQVRGQQPDGRDATFLRVDRTLHSDLSLTPGCVGTLWRRGWLVATEPELRGPDPSDPRYPNGRDARVGEMRFFVEEAVLSRQDCDDPGQEVRLQEAPTVIHLDEAEAEPLVYSRPLEDVWWIGGPRAALLRKVDAPPEALAWPE